jgi:hypothetical protein
MGTTIETLSHNDLTIKIVSDESPESPRDWDNLGTILGAHRRYRISDDVPHAKIAHEATSMDELVRMTASHHGERILWLPVRMYEHGSVGLKACVPGETLGYPWNCQWDSGWVGIVYVPYSKLRTEYNCKRVTGKVLTKAREVLSGEVTTYAEYINGEVYGYVIEDSEGNHLDSCYGFYGWDYVKSQAMETAENLSPLTVG